MVVSPKIFIYFNKNICQNICIYQEKLVPLHRQTLIINPFKTFTKAYGKNFLSAQAEQGEKFKD